MDCRSRDMFEHRPRSPARGSTARMSTGLVEGGPHPLVLVSRVPGRRVLRQRTIPTGACAVGRPRDRRPPYLWILTPKECDGCARANLSEDLLRPSASEPTCDARRCAAWLTVLAPFNAESVPTSPAIMAALTPTTAAPTPLAVTTRDCLSFSEPSALPLITRAVASPLWAFWREIAAERPQHALGGVAVLEDGKNHRLLRGRPGRTDLGHAPIVPRPSERNQGRDNPRRWLSCRTSNGAASSTPGGLGREPSIRSRPPIRSALSAEDLELMASSACMLGRDDAYLERWLAYHAHLGSEDRPRAARCTWWIGDYLRFRGYGARATGWFARGHRLLDQVGDDCVARGYLLMPALHSASAGDDEAVSAFAVEAGEIGERFGHRDLIALATMEQGHALVRQGRVAEGLRLVDETLGPSPPRSFRRSSPAPSTATRSRSVRPCSSLVVPGSGRRPIRSGASVSPTWWPTWASASCTAPRP